MALGLRGAAVARKRYSAAAKALFARMTSQPPAHVKAAIDALIQGAIADGWWAKMLGFSWLANSTEQASYLNWVVGGQYASLAPVGATYTWRAAYGWKGTGANNTGDYLSTGVNCSAILAQNDHSLFAYVRAPGGAGGAVVGQSDSTTDRDRILWKNGGNAAARLSDGTTLSAANAANYGLIVASRTGATVKKLYVAGAEIATAATASASPVATELVFARNGTTRSDDELTVVGCGLGLTAADVANMSARLEAFIAATEPRYFGVITSGQSNINRLFLDANTAGAGSGDGTANSNAATRVMKPALQAFLDAQFTDRPNELILVNKSVSGASMLPHTGQNNWWNFSTHTPGSFATDWQAGYNAADAANPRAATRRIWRDLHAQGEAEASDVDLVADWSAASLELFGWQAGLIPGLKHVVQPLGPNSLVADARIQAFRAAQDTWAGASLILAPEVCDTTRINGTDWHMVAIDISASGYDRSAKELARTLAFSFGCASVVWRGPELASAKQVDATNIDLTLIWPAGAGGNDFSPAIGLTGFKVTDGSGVKVLTSVARQSSSTIRLTTSTALAGLITVSHEPIFGGLDKTKMAVDNFTLPLPLRRGSVQAT